MKELILFHIKTIDKLKDFDLSFLTVFLCYFLVKIIY